MIKLTVFTPTYNRAKTLARTFISLKAQSDFGFVWLIVDDGSTDNTCQCVRQWQQSENSFEIKYIKKPHGGIHTAYNTAIKAASTEYFMCVDSDDFLTDTAVHDIILFFEQNKNERVAGAAALNCLPDGTVLGGSLPRVKYAHLMELRCKYKHKGDIKLIYKTDVLKSVMPIPEINKEENFNPYYLFLKADELLPLLVFDKAVCVVDYSTKGMHTRVFYDYVNSPLSFAELRRSVMKSKYASIRLKYRSAVHYVSSCIFSGETHFIAHSPCKMLVILAILPGAALNAYIRIKVRSKS